MSAREKSQGFRGNLLDRAIGYVSPSRAEQRVRSRILFEGLSAIGTAYDSADPSRRAFRSWFPSRGDANRDTLRGLPNQRYYSRDATRNMPIATAALERTVTFTNGTGLRALPEIDRDLLELDDEAADTWEASATREFNLFAESPLADATESQDLGELGGLALRSALESGDVFALILPVEQSGSRQAWPWQTSVQLFEADQVTNPTGVAMDGQEITFNGNRVFGGVEVNERGAPVAAHFLKRHPGATLSIGRDTSRIPFYTSDGRRQLLHLAPRLRPGQTRGVPFLSPVVEALKQISTYTEAELFAAVIGAMITVVHKTPGAAPLAPSNPNAQEALDQSDQDQFGLSPGTLLDLDHEDDLEVPTLGRPNAQFDPFVTSVCTQIGAALGIPREVIMLSFTASYSASRAALEGAQHFFRRQRAWLVRGFYGPVREAVLAESIARRRLIAPGFFEDALVKKAWLGASWHGPARISVDPLKENNANKVAKDEGWKTDHMITAEMTGGDWSRHIEQRGREMRQKQDALPAPAPAPANGQPPPNGQAPDDDKPDDRGDNEDEDT